ncbi:MAG: hypothetical protein MH132_06135 [Hydrotalea sp.]|nr:hypothetical protein [Hydrotalea sp.]
MPFSKFPYCELSNNDNPFGFFNYIIDGKGLFDIENHFDELISSFYFNRPTHFYDCAIDSFDLEKDVARHNNFEEGLKESEEERQERFIKNLHSIVFEQYRISSLLIKKRLFSQTDKKNKIYYKKLQSEVSSLFELIDIYIQQPEYIKMAKVIHFHLNELKCWLDLRSKSQVSHSNEDERGRISEDQLDAVYAFKWVGKPGQLEKLYDELKASKAISDLTEWDSFKEAFRGGPLIQSLGIKWILKPKNKLTNKKALDYLRYMLMENGLVRKIEPQNFKLVKQIYEKTFVDEYGNKFENWDQSKITDNKLSNYPDTVAGRMINEIIEKVKNN